MKLAIDARDPEACRRPGRWRRACRSTGRSRWPATRSDLVDRQIADDGVGGGVVIAGEQRASVDLDGGAGEIGVHVVVDGVAVAGGGGGEIAEIPAFHLKAADAEIGLEVGDLEIRAGCGGDDVAA